MKKYLLTIIFALIIGFFLGNFLLRQYDDYRGLRVSSDGEEVYFIQYGVYSSIESMEENTINLENYIYNIESDKYYVYIGITKDKNNLENIKNYFKSLGHETIVKNYFIKNTNFIELLNNYDLVLNQTEDTVAIASIICQVLQKYEEVVNSDSKN